MICAARGLGDLYPAFRRTLGLTFLAALLNPVAYYLILFEAYDRLPAQLAQPINIAWTMWRSWQNCFETTRQVGRLRRGRRRLFGVLIIVSQGQWNFIDSADWWGVFLAVGSTVIWAGYWTLNVMDDRPPLIGMTLNFLLATPMIGMLWWLNDGAWPPITGIAGSIYIGLFEMSLAFIAGRLPSKPPITRRRSAI